MPFIIRNACTDLREEGPFRTIRNPGCMYRFEGPFRTLHNPGYLYRFEGPFRGILNPLFYFNTYREGLTMNFVPRSTWFQPTRKEGREMTNRNGKIPTRSQNAPGACGGLGWHI